MPIPYKKKMRFFWAYGMATLTPEDEQYLEWMTSKLVECYWEFDQNGQRIGMVPRWVEALKEYERIKGLGEIQKSDLKVSRIP